MNLQPPEPHTGSRKGGNRLPPFLTILLHLLYINQSGRQYKALTNSTARGTATAIATNKLAPHSLHGPILFLTHSSNTSRWLELTPQPKEHTTFLMFRYVSMIRLSFGDS